ncbi:MAG: hypothetical protein LBV11_07005 [Bacillus cereus]|jgi:hypothetical protein|nr:hypothetical protein [Bacillus cereus]
METKFKKGDQVRILSCPVKPLCEGEIGVIKRVIPLCENVEKLRKCHLEDKNASSGLYKVAVKGKYIADYASDGDLELV